MDFALWWEVEQTRMLIGAAAWAVIICLYLVLKLLGKLSSPLFRK